MTLKKRIFTTIGWVSFGVGFIGIFLPLLPTVFFWVVAVWFWSKSSPSLMEKVYEYPTYGPQIKAFMVDGVISKKGKVVAIVSMILSYIVFQLLVKPDYNVGIIVAVVFSAISLWLLTRPEEVPNTKQ